MISNNLVNNGGKIQEIPPKKIYVNNRDTIIIKGVYTDKMNYNKTYNNFFFGEKTT